MASPAIPVPSRIRRAPSATSLRRRQLGQTKASAAPISSAEGPGVRAVVDPRRVVARAGRTWPWPQPRRRRAAAWPPRAGDGRRCARPREPAQPEPQQPRPDQVELLLHGQRPQVPERRRRAEPGEVGAVLGDQPPVAHVARGRGDRPADGRKLGPVQQRDPGGDHGQHHEQRGQQPPGPAQPEIRQLQPAGALVLAEQEVGDEVAAQREEDTDAEQAALSPAQIQVIGDNRQHGQSAQPVETGQDNAGQSGLAWA